MGRELGPDATVEKFAELYVAFDGNEAPYAIGLVRLSGGGPQVITRIEGEVVRGAQVELRGDQESDVYWFRAVGS